MPPAPSYARMRLARQMTDARVTRSRQRRSPVITPAANFHDQIDRSKGRYECWPWTGRTGSHGYGQVRVREDGWPTTVGAHRVAYYLATGFWSEHYSRSPARKVVRHLCHSKTCCNPLHLLIGTHGDNAWDDQMRRQGVDLVAIRIGLGEGPFLPVVGWAK